MENTNVPEVKMPITYDDLKQSLIDSGRPYDFTMIDRAYALAVTVIMDGQDSPSQMLTGCCSIAPFSSRSRATGWRWAPSVPNP